MYYAKLDNESLMRAVDEHVEPYATLEELRNSMDELLPDGFWYEVWDQNGAFILRCQVVQYA